MPSYLSYTVIIKIMIELLSKFNRSWQIFLLISIFCLPFFINLGGNSLWDGNEGFYAEPAREVVESGNYLIPTYNYQPRFKKPPLATWIIAFSYQTLGVSEFAERLPIAIAAILTIWITYLLGKLLADKELGIISALVLATMLKFMIYCRQYAGDIFLTLFISLTMFYFARAMIETERKKQNLYKLLAYLAMGLGMLDKGIVAIVVPMTMVGLFILLLRRWELIKLLFSPTGYLITGVVGASWYTLMYWKYGWDFIQVNIINETVKRYVTDELGGRAIYYYVGVYFSETLPWSIFIIPATIYWFKWWKEEKLNISQEKLKSFLPFLTIIWFIFIFIFFSLAVGKRAVYLVALYPAAAIIIAYYFRFNLFKHNKLLTNLHIALSLLLSIVCLASSIIIFLAYQKLEIRTNLIYLAITALVLLSLGLIASLKKLELQLPVILVSSWLLILSITLIMPKIEFYRPIPHFAQIIKSQASSTDKIGTFSVDTPSLMFYTQRAIFQNWKLEDMLKELADDKTTYFVTREDFLATLKQNTSANLEVLDSKPLLQLRWEHLFGKKNKPTMHLVLVRKKS